MPKYYYTDKQTNKQKKYVGNVYERDGKYYGTLVTPKTTYVVKDLELVNSHKAIDTENTHFVWKDKFGIEHELTDECLVKDNKVIDKRQYSFPVLFHPEIDEESYFIRKDNNERFNGEIIEDNGKFFGKIQKGA